MEYAPTADSITKDYTLVTDTDGLAQLVAEIRDAGRFALRVLADQTRAMRAGIVGLAVSTRARTARYIPMRHSGMHTGPQLTVPKRCASLQPLLEDDRSRRSGTI
jgi:DNA polymerase-1